VFELPSVDLVIPLPFGFVGVGDFSLSFAIFFVLMCPFKLVEDCFYTS
jgi:hypothetical protein